jgi:uncharacterized protein with NRDE domain
VCTVLLLLRPDEALPVLIGANRDERRDRRFLAPARHWPDEPQVIGGRDELGGGSWFALNDDGVVATIVNGMDQLGPQAGMTSRGELVLRALRERDAARAANAVGALPAERYRGFMLLIVDRTSAFCATNDGRAITVRQLAPGYHMVTPEGCDVPTSPRFAAHFAAFQTAPLPDPKRGDWSSWIELLTRTDDDDPHRATLVDGGAAFGTVSSALLVLDADRKLSPMFAFAPGPPGRTAYQTIATWKHNVRRESA